MKAWAEARILVVVAHPDDEVLGCGATLATLRDVRVVHVTDGAPRDGRDAARHGFRDPAGYAAARRREAEAGMALAGIPPERLSGLGVADQEVPFRLVAVTRALVPLVAPADIVLTHAYEGGHGDHDAVAFAVRAAQRLRGGEPAVVEMPFYHADAAGWVRQTFLPHPQAGPEILFPLDAAAGALKRRMVEAHATQVEVLNGFALDAERFRAAPPHDFAALPHAGPLLYERHGWNLDGARWIAQAEAARVELGLPSWR